MMKHADSESDMVFKALVEGTDNDGGYLVPAPLANEIWQLLPDFTVMRKLARVIPMTSKTLQLNELVARPSTNWASEYSTATSGSAEFEQKTLTAHKLFSFMPTTNELIADANVDIVRLITESFVREFAAKEDKAFFTGSGSGQPKGLTAETISNQSVGASITFDDIIHLTYMVPQYVRRRAATTNVAFVANQATLEIIRKIKDSDGNYILNASTVNGMTNGTNGVTFTMLGYPVYEQNDLPTDRLYFGDFRSYIIGDRKSISIETSRVGGDAWRRDSTEIRAVERVGGICALTTPFAYLKDI